MNTNDRTVESQAESWIDTTQVAAWVSIPCQQRVPYRRSRSEPVDPRRGSAVGGKGAMATLHRCHLRLYQSEQECGFGENNWRYCRYAWTLMKHYLCSGASAYLYRNISLQQHGLSRWGWAQNSLVTVDTQAKSFVYNPEYYLIKHASHFVRQGARLVTTFSFRGYENQLAFANRDGSVVIVMQIDSCEELPVNMVIGNRMISPILAADSFNTFVLSPEEPAT
jgi:glucosylceramidase